MQLVCSGSQAPAPVVPGLLSLRGLLLPGVPKLALPSPTSGSSGSPCPGEVNSEGCGVCRTFSTPHPSHLLPGKSSLSFLLLPPSSHSSQTAVLKGKPDHVPSLPKTFLWVPISL